MKDRTHSLKVTRHCNKDDVGADGSVLMARDLLELNDNCSSAAVNANGNLHKATHIAG